VLNCHTEPLRWEEEQRFLFKSKKCCHFLAQIGAAIGDCQKSMQLFTGLQHCKMLQKGKDPKDIYWLFSATSCTLQPVVGMGRYWGLFGMVWACPGVLLIFLTSKNNFSIVVGHWCHFVCSLCHWTPESRKKVWGRCGRWGITSHIETWIPLPTCCRSYYYYYCLGDEVQKVCFGLKSLPHPYFVLILAYQIRPSVA